MAMDAPNPSALPAPALRTPLHIGAVGLRVRDLDRVLGFYRDVIGLSEIERAPGRARLGAGGTAFLELEHAPDALPDDPRQAGLYHTAFLMPTRKDLAQWLLQVARDRVPITGASDHSVSEAVYLDDPEGNGVEVYADRPPELWRWENDLVVMATERLNADALLAEADPAASYVAPGGLRIGHVHLRVGELAQAERFYSDGVGLQLTRRRGGATFMSSARYHHHVAANVWHSAGAGARDANRAGLAWVALEANDAAETDAVAARLRDQGAPVTPIADGFESADPWGTRVRFVNA
jgi:catechol 2,3-dioxygenase